MPIEIETKIPPIPTLEQLPAIEHDEEMDRIYIPLPGGWEIQTKGKGSSFRIANTKTGDHWLIADEYIHKMLEDMAMDIRTTFLLGPPPTTLETENKPQS